MCVIEVIFVMRGRDMHEIGKTRTITSDIMDPSSRTKSAGHRIRRSRNTHLTARGLHDAVVPEITKTIDSLALNFCVYAICRYHDRFLRLWTHRASNTRPVKVESEATSRWRPKS